MNDNVRKIFDILGVEPNEKFNVDGCGNPTLIFTIDENLIISDDRENIHGTLLTYLLRGDYKIIKLPKKKKLRVLTPEEYISWVKSKCAIIECKKCIFDRVNCTYDYDSWVKNKNLYSDKFLDQEIEVEE